MDKFTLTMDIIAENIDAAEEFAAAAIDSASGSIAVGNATLTSPDGTVVDLLDDADNEVDEDAESDFIDDETDTATDTRQHIN